MSTMPTRLALLWLRDHMIEDLRCLALSLPVQEPLLNLRVGGLGERVSILQIARDFKRSEVLSTEIPDFCRRRALGSGRRLENDIGFDLFLTNRIGHADDR